MCPPEAQPLENLGRQIRCSPPAMSSREFDSDFDHFATSECSLMPWWGKNASQSMLWLCEFLNAWQLLNLLPELC